MIEELENIARQLTDQLIEMRAHQDAVMLQKKALLEQVMPKEVLEQIDEIEVEFSPTLQAIDDEIDEIEHRLRGLIIGAEESYKGENLTVKYSQPRKTWDAKKLEQLARRHPEIAVEIERCSKVGDKPSITFMYH